MNTRNQRFLMPWIVLAAIALSLRAGTVLLLWSPEADIWTYEHGEIAENLLAGRGFSVRFLGDDGPTSQQAPLYPALLAGAYWGWGTASPAALLAVQLLQCVAGTLLVLTVVWLCRALLPDEPLIGWIAGWGAAAYPTHVYMVTHIQVAVWTAWLLTLLLAVVLDRRIAGRGWTAAGAGLIAGLLLLFEPIMALAVPIAGIVLWRGSRRRRPVGAFLAVTLAVVSPWLVRNALAHGEFVFVKSTFGYAFWQGNNPASWGTDKIPKSQADQIASQHDDSPAGVHEALWEARHETVYIDDLLLKPDGYRQLAGLSEPEKSRRLGRQAAAFIRAAPVRYLTLCARRLRYFLLFDETNPKTAHPAYRAATVLWLLLAAAGAVMLRRRWRELWPAVAVFVGIAAFHTFTIVSARFRIPVEPLSFVWCAAAVLAIWRGAVGRLRRIDQTPHDTWQTGNTRRAA